MVATSSFIQNVKSLTWKNYLLKKRYWGITIVEFIYPFLNLLSICLYQGVFTTEGSVLHGFFTSKQWFTFIFYLTLDLGSYITLALFINFQAPREKELNVESTLEIMNVSKFSSEMAFVVIQQPGVIIRTLVIAMGEYIIPKKDDGNKDVL